MAYSIVVTDKAEKDLDDLPKDVALRIVSKLKQLAEDPLSIKSKKLTGSSFYRIRVGDYRVLYEIENEELIITVIKAGHRKDVYKGL